MSYKGIRIAVLCGATVLTSGAMFGQTCTSGMGMKGSGGFSAHDKTFLRKAAEGNMAEIKTAQIALEKGSSPDVKDFAQKMVDDHTKLGEQMKPILEKAGIAEPTKLSPADEALGKKLSALSGDTFDKQYISAMVKDHHKDLSEFKGEESSTKNDELKSAVSQGTQVIQEHTTMIDGIASKHGVSAPHASSM